MLESLFKPSKDMNTFLIDTGMFSSVYLLEKQNTSNENDTGVMSLIFKQDGSSIEFFLNPTDDEGYSKTKERLTHLRGALERLSFVINEKNDEVWEKVKLVETVSLNDLDLSIQFSFKESILSFFNSGTIIHIEAGRELVQHILRGSLIKDIDEVLAKEEAA